MKIIYLAFNLSAQGGVRAHNKAFFGAIKATGNDCYLVELRESSLFGKISFIARTFFWTAIFKPELIIAGHINFSPLCLFIKKIFRTKYAVTVHGIDAWGLKDGAKLNGLRGAEKIISVSNYTAERLKKEWQDLGGKFVVIPNSADPARFKIAGKPTAIIGRHNLAGKKVILTVARLAGEEGYKGYDKIISVMPDVLKKIPNAKYLLVGDGSDKGRVEALVKKLHLEESVVLAGRVGDGELPDYYNSADVFAMPSSGEGFGMVFIEASASGIPVVAGNVDGSVDAAAGGKLGILVNPASQEEIADAIITMLSGRADKKFYDREYLRKTTIENFGPDIVKEKINFFIKNQI